MLFTIFSGIGVIKYALKDNILFTCSNRNCVKQSYFTNYDISEKDGMKMYVQLMVKDTYIKLIY